MRSTIAFVWIAFAFVILFEVAQQHLEVSQPSVKNIFIALQKTFQQIASHFRIEWKQEFKRINDSNFDET